MSDPREAVAFRAYAVIMPRPTNPGFFVTNDAVDRTARRYADKLLHDLDAVDPLRLALRDEAVIRRLANVKTPGGVQRVLESLQ